MKDTGMFENAGGTQGTGPAGREWPGKRPCAGFRPRMPVPGRAPGGRQAGFTLVELIVVVVITAMIMGIVSTSMSFSVRVWDRARGKKVAEYAPLLDLLGQQIRAYQLPLSAEGAESGGGGLQSPFFVGKDEYIVFVTTYSLKAVSRGTPVVVRYQYNSSEGRLFYREMIYNPYDSEGITDFTDESLTGEKGEPGDSVFSAELKGFSFAYYKKDGDEEVQEWDKSENPPDEIVLRYNSGEDEDDEKGEHVLRLAPAVLSFEELKRDEE